MTSFLHNAAQQAAQAAHSGVTSLLAAAQATPGTELPSFTVKENDPQESFALNNVTGRNVFVCIMFIHALIYRKSYGGSRSAFQEHSAQLVVHNFLATFKTTKSIKPKVSQRST